MLAPAEQNSMEKMVREQHGCHFPTLNNNAEQVVTFM